MEDFDFDLELENYRIVANSIQLKSVRLYRLSVERKQESIGKEAKVRLNFKRSVKLKKGNNGRNELLIFLETKFEEIGGNFTISFVYEGLVKSKEDIETDTFKDYAYQQVIPLLLPYARTTLTSLLMQMKLPGFEIPTIDVMQSRAANGDSDAKS